MADSPFIRDVPAARALDAWRSARDASGCPARLPAVRVLHVMRAVCAAVDEAQARGQHGLDADRAGRRFRKGQALGLDVLGVVVGHHGIDQA